MPKLVITGRTIIPPSPCMLQGCRNILKKELIRKTGGCSGNPPIEQLEGHGRTENRWLVDRYEKATYNLNSRLLDGLSIEISKDK